MKYTKKAFSMIELIIAVSILTIISAIAITSMDGSKERSNNSKVLSDIKTLANAFETFSQEQKVLPTPAGNLQYYGEDTGYRHDMNDAFGVSGFVSQEVLPAKYLNLLPLDPKTGQYYAYAKTKHTNHFEVAGVITKNTIAQSVISGNWAGEYGPYNLVKEYAGPNFVFDGGEEYFPYNPNEKMLIGKISSYSGTLTINGKNYSESEILSYTLGQGDIVKISSGGTVNIYFSDGSNTVLGDVNSDSEVTLSEMKYIEENNLFTSVKLFLNFGSLWTKASKMSDKSGFEVTTSDAVAAVRGTIFGVSKDTESNILVQQGKVEVADNQLHPITSPTDAVTFEDGKSFIEVVSGSGVKGIASHGGTSFTFSTGALEKITDIGSGMIIQNIAEINSNQQLELQKIEQKDLNNFTIDIALNTSFLHADYLKLTTSKNDEKKALNFWKTYTGGTLTLTGKTLFSSQQLRTIISTSPEIKLAFCNEKNAKERCTRPLKLNIKDNVGFSIENKPLHFCEKDIDTIYNKFFSKPITKPLCKQLLSIPGWSEKTFDDKQTVIKKMMTGKYCDMYQKENGTLSGTGYIGCRPNYVFFGNEKVPNLFAGKGYQLVAYAGYNDDVNIKTLTGTIDGTSVSLTNHFHQFNTDSGVFDEQSEDIQELEDANLNSLGFDVSFSGSIYTWGNYGKGVLLDNKSTDDTLSYADLGLTSTGTYAIEMKVRGASLKRAGTGHTLFSIGSSALNLTSDGDIKIATNNFLTKDNIQLLTLKDHTFYSVVLNYSNQNATVSIYDGEKLLKKSPILPQSITGSDLYIGNKLSISQWNDIIDEVKIYVKPQVTLLDLQTIVGVQNLDLSLGQAIGGSISISQ